MGLFRNTNIKSFNLFEELYESNLYAVCNLLEKFSINVHTIGGYKDLLEKDSKIPVVEDIDKNLFGCYILKETNDARNTISGIIINDELCSSLKLTISDKLAAIAHEIGHIMFFFLENKQIDEELKADEFACKIGLSLELLGLLDKIKGANMYSNTIKEHIELRLQLIKIYVSYYKS